VFLSLKAVEPTVAVTDSDSSDWEQLGLGCWGAGQKGLAIAGAGAQLTAAKRKTFANRMQIDICHSNVPMANALNSTLPNIPNYISIRSWPLDF